jgi:hypothetical protein
MGSDSAQAAERDERAAALLRLQRESDALQVAVVRCGTMSSSCAVAPWHRRAVAPCHRRALLHHGVVRCERAQSASAPSRRLSAAARNRTYSPHSY